MHNCVNNTSWQEKSTCCLQGQRFISKILCGISQLLAKLGLIATVSPTDKKCCKGPIGQPNTNNMHI